MFGTVDIKARPLRLAHLVDPNDADQVRSAIRLSSTLWGGAYFPIVPLYKRLPKSWRDHTAGLQATEVALGYIDAFDPDFIVQFARSLPDQIVRLGLEIIKPDDIWKSIEEDWTLSPRYGIGAFEILKQVFDEHFKYKAKYPVKVVVPTIPKEHALLWASVFGEIPGTLLPMVEKHYAEALAIEKVDFKVTELQEILADDVLFPRRLTQFGLRSFGRAGFRREANVFFLDATKADDILDFWNLRASGKQVIPVPRQLKDVPEVREFVVRFLKAYRRPWRNDPSHMHFATIIRSRNSKLEDVQDFGRGLKIERAPDDPSNDPFFGVQHWYPRIWDEWARDKDGVVPSDVYSDDQASTDIDDPEKLRFRVRPLLPKVASRDVYHGEPRCANEVTLRFYGANEHLAEVFPRSQGRELTRAIGGSLSLEGDWRVGRNGIVKLVKDTVSQARSIPTAQDVFFGWLSDLGWKAKLSPPGHLAKQLHQRLDGYHHVLRDERVLALLEHMNGGAVRRGGGEPLDETRAGQERDLPVGEVVTRLGNPGKPRLHEYLVSKGVFRLGIRIQCPLCFRNSWYSAAEVRDQFACPRCQESFTAIGNLEHGTWSYKTAGPFSVRNYAEGAYAVLLALDFFDSFRMGSVRSTRIPSFTAETPGKKRLEADYALFWDGSGRDGRMNGVLFGESKTFNHFEEKDFVRMRHLAKEFPGAVLVFSTLRKSLTKGEIEGITRIAKRGRKYWKAARPINPVLVLTGSELLGDRWDEALRTRFSHLWGLLELCDATQQFYLGLRSWHDEWHDRWERRRERRQARTRDSVNGRALRKFSVK